MTHCDFCESRIAVYTVYNVIIVEKRTSIFQTPAEIPIPWEVAIPRTRIESVWWAPDLLFRFILYYHSLLFQPMPSRGGNRKAKILGFNTLRTGLAAFFFSLQMTGS